MPTAGWMNGLSRRNQRLVAKDVEIFTKKYQSPRSSTSVLVTHEGSKEVFFLQYRRKSRASLPIGRCPGECLSIIHKTPHT